jgi:tetratricopeptide (TPR) repeat protein
MIALVLSVALFAQPAAAAWREHPEFLRGSAAFEAQRWDEAARAFEAAYADHPRPELLWAQAQALRFGGRCKDALPLYDRFLATGPTAEEIADANTNIAACRELVGEAVVVPPVEPAPLPEAVAEPLPSAPAPAPTVKPTPRDSVPRAQRRPGRDPWGHGLLWSGVGVAGVGAGLLAAGHAQRADASGASTEYEYEQKFEGAPALGQAGIAVLVTGAALVTAGIVRFAVVSARARRGNGTMARLGKVMR